MKSAYVNIKWRDKMKNCEHKNIDRGLRFPTMKYFSFCKDCGKKWLDGGKRWEAQRN